MQITRLEPTDFDLIAGSKDYGFTDCWNEKMLASAYAHGSLNGYIIKENGKLVAFITYVISYDFADIADVFTHPDYRKKGYAKELISRAIEDIKSKKISSILLEVRQGNIPAISLYESLGFVEISIRKKYYDDGENALVLKKEL